MGVFFLCGVDKNAVRWTCCDGGQDSFTRPVTTIGFIALECQRGTDPSHDQTLTTGNGMNVICAAPMGSRGAIRAGERALMRDISDARAQN